MKYNIARGGSFKLSYQRIHQFINQISNTAVISPADYWKSADTYIPPLVNDQIASVSAQSTLPKNWDTEKIKGSALLAYPSASGHSFFNEKFWNGGLEFLDGVKIGDLKLRYSEYRDEFRGKRSKRFASLAISEMYELCNLFI